MHFVPSLSFFIYSGKVCSIVLQLHILYVDRDVKSFVEQPSAHNGPHYSFAQSWLSAGLLSLKDIDG